MSTVEYPGVCPVQGCLYEEAHAHPVCNCGAVLFTNPVKCAACLVSQPKRERALERSQLVWRMRRAVN